MVRPREQDVAVAEAEVALARAHLPDAEPKCQKTMIKSPIDGVGVA